MTCLNCSEKDTEIASLRSERDAGLVRENALRENLAESMRENELWRRGFREREKRRSSRPERRAPREKKRPGRKAGHKGAFRPEPEHIDRRKEHPLPEQCECGGVIDPTGEFARTVVQDIPPEIKVENVEHVAPIGCCRKCGRRAHAPMPGDPPAGTSIAKTQIGPNLQAVAITLHHVHHVSLAGIGAFLAGLCGGFHVSRGALARMFARLAQWSRPAYAEIAEHIRNAPVVGVDETGHRQGGVPGYLWIARTPTAALFRVELSRGGWVIDGMLGPDFAGVVVSDFYAVYTTRDWINAYCWAHLIREAKKFAELDPVALTLGFLEWLRDIHAWGQSVQEAWNESERRGIAISLGRLANAPRFEEHADLARLQNRIHQCFHGLLTFVDHPDVPADNNATERDLRSHAYHRKMTGGTRSTRGSETLAHWMSILKTREKNGLSLRDFIVAVHESRRIGAAPPSVFQQGRPLPPHPRARPREEAVHGTPVRRQGSWTRP